MNRSDPETIMIVPRREAEPTDPLRVRPAGRSGFWTGLFVLLAVAAPAPGTAQFVGPDSAVTDLEGPMPIQRDYFVRELSPEVKAYLAMVERYHLTEENFWPKYRTGQYGSARGDLMFILRYFPNHPKALFLLSADRRLAPDVSLVIRCFERAIAVFPQHAYTYVQYGQFLISLGNLSAGLRLLEQALEIEPNMPLARAAYFEARAKLGEGRGGAARPKDATPIP